MSHPNTSDTLESKTESLKQSSFLQVLREGLFERVAELSQRKTYKAGEFIFIEHSDSDEVYHIESGQVEVSVMLVDADQSLTKVMLEAGDSLGEIGFVTSQPRLGTAKAINDVSLLVWDAQHLRDWCDRHPAEGYVIMSHIARVLAKRLNTWQVRILDSISWGAM